MNVTLRNSTPHDAAAIKSVQDLAFATLRKIYRPAPHASTPTDSKADLTTLVATAGTTVVGVVRYCLQDGRLHLIGLAVHPNHQRQGIARQLVDHLATLARTRGLQQLSLYTIEQTGNVPIFEKLGFAVRVRTPAQDLQSVTGQPLTEAFMAKPL